MSEKKREKLLFISITALGVSAIITQLVLIREFLSVFYGNELIFGIIFANWLLLTGFGAYLGKFNENIKHKLRFIIFSQIFIAVLPFLYLFGIRLIRNILFPIGSLVGTVEVFIISLILLAPYCILSGFLLTLFCSVLGSKDNKSIGNVYFLDSLGDILGGFLFSFVFVLILNPFQMVFFILVVNLFVAFLLADFDKRKLLASVVLIFLIMSTLIVFFDLEQYSKSMQFPNQELIFNKNTFYGDVAVTRTEEQLNFYENGLLLFNTEDTITNEEVIHYAMSQHDDPKTVLLISGGISGTVNEILKYDVDRIDYVELDPVLIKVGKQYTTNLDNPKINIINNDGRLYVKQTSNRYDVIIIDLPDPSTAQLNRFYSKEFFKELKNILSQNGLVSTSLISFENYISKEAQVLNSALYNTMKGVYTNVIIIPGSSNFFIASDSYLTYDISLKVRNLENDYVNKDYLKGILTKDRIDYLMDSLDETVAVNKDFRPSMYYYHLLYWTSQFKTGFGLIFLLLGVFLIVYLLRIKPITFSIFTTGFSAAGLEVVLLIGFQILFGYVYHKIGIIITMFMLGLAIGSFYMNKNIKKKGIETFIKLESMIMIFSLVLPLFLILVNQVRDSFLLLVVNHVLFPISMLILAIFVGMEFPLAAKISFKGISKTASRLYNADLIGASIGAIIVAAFAIPILGIINTCMLIAILNTISLGYIFINKHKY